MGNFGKWLHARHLSHASLRNVTGAFATALLQGMTTRKGDVFRSVSMWWMLVGERGQAGARASLSGRGSGGNRYSRLLVRLPTPPARGKCYLCTPGTVSASIAIKPSPTSTTTAATTTISRVGRYASPSLVRQNRHFRIFQNPT